MADRRKNGSSSRGNSGHGGGGSRRSHKGGGNNGFHAPPSSNDYYGSQRSEYGRPPSMADKNAWDDHAREVDEAALIKKGLLPKREHRTSSAYEEDPSDYPDYERNAYPEERYANHDRDYGPNEGYDRRGVEEPPYYQEYEAMTPPRSNHSQNGDRRDDDYRNARSTSERETWRSIEEEYVHWSSAELSRELSRLQRRSDVVREMLQRAEEREREITLEHYSTYADEREFMQNVREGESFYERDVGLSPLGRQALNVQQRRNDQGRGFIPASRLDRYGNGNGREEYRSDGGRRREEERRDGGEDRGERRDSHRENNNKKRRNKKRHPTNTAK